MPIVPPVRLYPKATRAQSIDKKDNEEELDRRPLYERELEDPDRIGTPDEIHDHLTVNDEDKEQARIRNRGSSA